ncbi:metallo-beta-lactamase domain protein [Clostridium sp. CAG:632]|jgi:hydroxyacylglutathione hydrolase|nr:metallo-beta-lactamase domain protein [Clostridium sp. CAG:632]
MQELIVITNQLGDFMTNCYTVYNAVTRDAVLIDPACNARFLNNILVNEQLNCVAILLTHGHYDHIGALPELMELVGHKVPIYASAEEEDVLNDPRKNLSTMLSGQMVTVKPDILLQDDQEIELLDTKLRCFLVPGHTKGGMCYYFAENGILFSGDTLFARSIGRSDFPTGDGIKLVKSIKEKLMTLPDETIVYPGHNERTTIGKERNANPFIQ